MGRLPRWLINDRKTRKCIVTLSKDIQRNVNEDIGKSLSLQESHCWSRRTIDEHPIVYAIKDNADRIARCHYRYEYFADLRVSYVSLARF